MALVILGRRSSSGRQLATSIAAELPIVVFGPATLTLTGSAPVASVAESGGLEWLPDGAIVYADFVNGHYYYDGAERTFETMFEENDDWFPLGNLHVVAEGLDIDQAAVLTTAAAAELLSGFTVVTYNDYAGPSYASTVELLELPGFSIELSAHFLPGSTGVRAHDFVGDVFAEVIDESAAGLHRLAATLSPTKLAVSVDGSAADSETPTAVGAFDTVALATGDAYLKTIAFYPVQDDAALPALSTL